MKTIEITKKEIIDILRLDLISEIQALEKSLRLFEMKYNKSFEEFENGLVTEKENFEKWDDYIEWKAYIHAHNDKINSLKDLESAEDIKVTT